MYTFIQKAKPVAIKNLRKDDKQRGKLVHEIEGINTATIKKKRFLI